MGKQGDYAQAITFTDEPEDAIVALRGVSCILELLSDSTVTCHRHVGDAYATLGHIVDAAATKLQGCISEND